MLKAAFPRISNDNDVEKYSGALLAFIIIIWLLATHDSDAISILKDGRDARDTMI